MKELRPPPPVGSQWKQFESSKRSRRTWTRPISQTRNQQLKTFIPQTRHKLQTFRRRHLLPRPCRLSLSSSLVEGRTVSGQRAGHQGRQSFPRGGDFADGLLAEGLKFHTQLVHIKWTERSHDPASPCPGAALLCKWKSAATSWNCEGRQQLLGVSYSFCTTSGEMCVFAKTF